MKPITEYANKNIRFNTTETLYWMARAAKDIKSGDAKTAHAAILNALGYIHNLSDIQTRIEDLEQPNWEQIYCAGLDSANARISEGD